MKVVPVVLILALRKNITPKFFIDLFYAAIWFTLLNFIVTILQYSQLFPVLSDFLFRFYNLEGTRNLVFSNSKTLFRAAGLCPGMGELGTLNAIFFLYFAIFFALKKHTYTSVIGMLLTYILIILSQSRTSLIGFGIAIFVLLANLGINKVKYIRKRSAVMIISVFIVCSITITYFLSYIHYFKLFIEQGLELSSFDGRQNIWRKLFAVIDENPDLLPLGYGRLSFPGQSVFDNEYIYMFVIQGIFVFLLFYGIIFSLTFKYLINWKHLDGIKPLILSILVMGLVCSLGLLFFTEPVKSIIVTLLICSTHKFAIKDVHQRI
jgi:O-antigen ligase